MGKIVVRYYEDAWYKVEYVINEITLDFKAWKIIALDGENSSVEKEPHVWGTVKWDDCVNFMHENGYSHYCGIHHVEQYNLLWNEIYKFKWSLGGSFLNEKGEYAEIDRFTEEEFNYKTASKIDINDGCVKCIWLEYSETTEFDNSGCVVLCDGGNALIEFENGKKMIITNSEWGSLNWL